MKTPLQEMMMAGYKTLVGFLFCAGILLQGSDSGVTCKNDSGHEVDWYILYKYPKAYGDGLRYLYMDESTNGWKLSQMEINSPSGTLANTLKPLLDFYDRKTEGFGYLLYSDQPPGYDVSASFGHSKGVVLFDRQTGIWLSHSTPRFPTYRNRNFWPNSGNENAQTFLCVTYPYNQSQTIGLQLMYIHAYSFDSDIPATFFNELRCIAQRNCFPRQEPWFRNTRLTSWGGRVFLSFAKYTRFKDDLYSGLIAQTMKQNLYVKCWGTTKSVPLPSNCSIPYHVYNVKTVKLPKQNVFKDTVDHSKWCVTVNSGWTCIADLNRHESQMKRGGGAICTTDVRVWNAFDALISEYEPCPHPNGDTQREL